MIAKENGILPILTFDQTTHWADLLSFAHPYLDHYGLSRLQSAIGETTKCIAVEKHYIDKDYRDTFTNYHAKRFSTPDSRCIRLHFFGAPIDHESLLEPNKAQPNYLGYSVIRPTRPNCVGRTLLDAAACGVKNSHISQCVESVSIQGTELKAMGFPFISQDADVTVCAQSAMWTVARYFSNKYPYYPEIYPYQLTALTRDYSIGRLTPSAGLLIWQMAEALRQLGFASLIYDRHRHASEFDHLMYTYIESGIPILAAFDRHVVTLFGHESDFADINTAQPKKGKEFLFSSEFNTTFIGHDDNGPPYQMLQYAETVKSMQKSATEKYKISDIEQFIAPLPQRVFLNAESFETVVVATLKDPYFGLAKMSPTLTNEPTLLRLFLTTGRSFKKRLDRGMGHPQVAALYRDIPLPHFIWVCELSLSSIYPRRVLGEVLWDATRNADEPSGLIALHYPEGMWYDIGSALNGPVKLEHFVVQNGSDYPIYENNLVHV